MAGVTKIWSSTPAVPQLMVVFFSLLLLTLGLHSVYIAVETLQSALFDHFKVLRHKQVYTTIVICVVYFLLSIPYCTNGGIYLFLLMDDSVMSCNAFVIAILEVMIVGWALGIEKFFDHVNRMGMNFKKETLLFGKICLQYVCPLSGLAILGLSASDYITDHHDARSIDWSFQSETYSAEFDCKNGTENFVVCSYTLPVGAEVLSWLIGGFILSFIPIFGVLSIVKKMKNGLTWKSLFQPTDEWRPLHEDPRPFFPN